jgi:hypothetical protein
MDWVIWGVGIGFLFVLVSFVLVSFVLELLGSFLFFDGDGDACEFSDEDDWISRCML